LTVAFISGAVTKMSDPKEAMVESGPVSKPFAFAFLLSALPVASTRDTSTCNAGHALAGSLKLTKKDAAAAADETAVTPKALAMVSTLQVLKKRISAGSFTSYKRALPDSSSFPVALDEDPKTIAVVKAFKLQSAAELKVHCFVAIVPFAFHENIMFHLEIMACCVQEFELEWTLKGNFEAHPVRTKHLQLQVVLSAMILSECVYKLVDVGPADSAKAASIFVSQLPPGLVSLQHMQSVPASVPHR
jgi:hypothetical protein